jgi:hypothetical protein
MIRFLHHLSGFMFYALGLTFFAAYILLRNNTSYSFPSALWLQVADLPLALVTIVYGGTSLFLSLHSPTRRSIFLGIIITLPLVALFLLLLFLNFYKQIEAL